MKLYIKLRIVSSLFVVGAVMIILPGGYYWLRSKAMIASASPIMVTKPAALPVDRADLVYGHPKELIIPSLSKDLAVIDGTYDAATGEWTITTDKAQYATLSVQPNNLAGNTLVYGHYRWEVFASLHTIQPGAEAIIVTDNGYRFYYAFRDSEAVSPTDTEIIAYKGKPQLTLQTCSGLYYQNRQLHYFEFVRYEKV